MAAPAAVMAGAMLFGAVAVSAQRSQVVSHQSVRCSDSVKSDLSSVTVVCNGDMETDPGMMSGRLDSGASVHRRSFIARVHCIRKQRNAQGVHCCERFTPVLRSPHTRRSPQDSRSHSHYVVTL